MATIEGNTSLAVTKGEIAKELLGLYTMNIVEYDAGGAKSTLNVPVPDGSSEFRQWSILARAALLKSTTWSRFTMPQIMLGVMFADKVGLDIELGDVYSTDGRPAISAEGRIKLAMRDPRYRGFKTTTLDTGKPFGKQNCVAKNDLECTVEVYVEGWREPIRRTALLSRWYKPTPAWNERPEHQLELNTLGHACRFLKPVGDPEDAGAPDYGMTQATNPSPAGINKIPRGLAAGTGGSNE